MPDIARPERILDGFVGDALEVRVLAQHQGKLLTHRALLREVWGPAYQVEAHYLHVYISHLRRKIEPDPTSPRYLLTEPGAGYRLVEPV